MLFSSFVRLSQLLISWMFQLNIPAIGFAPITNTQKLAHSHNEYLNAEIYKKETKSSKCLV